MLGHRNTIHGGIPQVRLLGGRIFVKGGQDWIDPQECWAEHYGCDIKSMALVKCQLSRRGLDSRTCKFALNTCNFIFYVKDGRLHILDRKGKSKIIEFNRPVISVVDIHLSVDYVAPIPWANGAPYHISKKLAVFLEDGSLMCCTLNGCPESIMEITSSSFLECEVDLSDPKLCSYVLTAVLRKLQGRTPMVKCVAGEECLFSLCDNGVLFRIDRPNGKEDTKYANIDLYGGEVMEENVSDILEVIDINSNLMVVVKDGGNKVYFKNGRGVSTTYSTDRIDWSSDTTPMNWLPSKAKSARA